MLAAKVTSPLASIPNGPAVIGVTSVLTAVTATPFNVSFVVTLSIVVAAFVVATVVGPSFTASIVLDTTTVALAVSQFVGFAPTSHNS